MHREYSPNCIHTTYRSQDGVLCSSVHRYFQTPKLVMGRMAPSFLVIITAEQWSIGINLLHMRLYSTLAITLVLCLSSFCDVCAKSFRFRMDKPIDVVMTRSALSGKKMVRVTAVGSSADKAIDQALVDAASAVTFYGLSNPETLESVPSILIDGTSQYNANKKFFDQFFKRGNFLQYVSRVTSTYPTGTNNVKTSKGQRVTIFLIVDWSGLERFYRQNGLDTQLSILEKL